MANAALAIIDDTVPAHITKGKGRGNEDVTADHLTIPRIKLLQKMSDEVDRHHPNYIDGANDGDFMNSLTREIYGQEIYVVSIKFKDEHVVWRKREAGGGLLGSFGTFKEAQAAVQAEDKPEDYDINQTHSHILLLKDPETGELSRPAIMDFSSSKLRVSKNWNAQILNKGGDRFAGLWKLKAVSVSNSSGKSWMNLEAGFVGWTTKEDYKVAEGYYESFAAE